MGHIHNATSPDTYYVIFDDVTANNAPSILISWDDAKLEVENICDAICSTTSYITVRDVTTQLNTPRLILVIIHLICVHYYVASLCFRCFT